MDALREYCAAFFDSPCTVLPSLELTPGKSGQKHGRLSGYSVGWRNVCPTNGKKLPAGQYNASDILSTLRETVARREGVLRVLGVTMSDLYSGGDDLFTIGLADMRSAGVFSFARYRPERDGFTVGASRWSEARRSAVLTWRACKTAVHEIFHLFNCGHCVYRACCMQGSGHLREDFVIPHHLCPCCLAKLKWVFGPEMRLARRAQSLLRFYRTHPGFEAEAAWMAAVLRRMGEVEDPDEAEESTQETSSRKKQRRRST